MTKRIIEYVRFDLWTWRASLLLTSVSVLVMAVSLSQAQFIIGDLGLIHSLPVTFFIGLGLLTLASAILWRSPQNHGKLLCLQACLLITGLWLTPLIITGFHSYPYHRPDHPYMFYAYTDYIIQWAHLNPGTLSYHNWPAVFLLNATILLIGGINISHTMIALTPFLLQFLYLFPLYLFFRNILGRSNNCWAGVWLFYLGNWMGGSYLGAHGFGLFLFLTTLAILTKSSVWEKATNALAYRLISIVFLVGIIITHLVSSFVVLIGLMGLYLGKKIRSFTIIILATVFFGFWMLYGATMSFNAGLPVLRDSFLRLDIFTQRGVLEPLTVTSEAHQTVALFRILTTGIFLAIAFAGGITGRKIKRDISNDKTILLMAISFTLAPILLGPGLFLEVPERAFIYILPLIAFFGIKLLASRTTGVILYILLLILLPLHFISNYGNEVIDYLSPSNISALDFFEDYTSEGYITGGYCLGYKKWEQGIYDHLSLSFDELQWKDDKLIYKQAIREDTPHYISVTQHDKAWYAFNYNKPLFIEQVRQHLNATTNVNLIYANPDLSMYIRQ